MNHAFSNDELATLVNLRGQKFKFVAGLDLWPALTAPSAFIVTEGQSISLEATSEEFKIDEEWEDFSQIKVRRASTKEIEAAVSLGYVDNQYSAEEILSVKVISDKIKFTLNGETTLDYISHSGIVIGFAHGSIAIMKLDHHQPILKVVHDPGFDANNTELPSHRFNENMYQSFSLERQTITIQ